MAGFKILAQRTHALFAGLGRCSNTATVGLVFDLATLSLHVDRRSESFLAM
jgi:hypothetical protein